MRKPKLLFLYVLSLLCACSGQESNTVQKALEESQKRVEELEAELSEKKNESEAIEKERKSNANNNKLSKARPKKDLKVDFTSKKKLLGRKIETLINVYNQTDDFNYSNVELSIRYYSKSGQRLGVKQYIVLDKIEYGMMHQFSLNLDVPKGTDQVAMYIIDGTPELATKTPNFD